MKSANLQSSTDPFVKKLKRLCTQPFIFIAAAPEAVGFIWSVLCWWNVVKCSNFLPTATYFHEIKYLFAVLKTDEYEVSHLQQHLVNYGKFSEVP